MTPYQHWLGVSSPRPNFYELLGVSAEEVQPAVIQVGAQAVREKLSAQAPGKYLDRWQAILQEIQTAEQTLLQPTLRAEYDKLVLNRGASEAAQAMTARISGSHPLAAGTASSTVPGSGGNVSVAATRPRLDPMAPLTTAARPSEAIATQLARPGGSTGTLPHETFAPASGSQHQPPRSNEPIRGETFAPASGSQLGRSRLSSVKRKPRARKNPYVGPLVGLVVAALCGLGAVTGVYLYATGAWQRLIGDPASLAQRPLDSALGGTPTGSLDNAQGTGTGSNSSDGVAKLARPTVVPDSTEATGGTAMPAMTDGAANSTDAETPNISTGTGESGSMNGTNDPTGMTPPATVPLMPDLPPATPEDIQATTDILRAAWTQLESRQPEAALATLTSANFDSVHPTQQARLTAMTALAERVESYWKAVAKSVSRLKPLQELTIGSSTILIIVEVSPDKLIYRFQGKNETRPIRDLQLGLTMLLAEKALDPGNPMTPVTLGSAYLAQPEPRIDEARTRWDSAISRGAELDDLMPVLEEIPQLTEAASE